MKMGHRSHKISLTDLLHAEVFNPNHDLLGEVSDVVVDAEEGLVVYVYLGLEQADRYITVPWSAFEVGDDQRLVLDVSNETLLAIKH